MYFFIHVCGTYVTLLCVLCISLQLCVWVGVGVIQGNYYIELILFMQYSFIYSLVKILIQILVSCDCCALFTSIIVKRYIHVHVHVYTCICTCIYMYMWRWYKIILVNVKGNFISHKPMRI